MSRLYAVVALAVMAVFAASTTGCPPAGEGVEQAKVPPEVEDDYAVFAQRCSKCHSLSRPLQSGIESDVFWEHYVARMRAMPGSGISADDAVKILRFLHYWSAEQRKKHGELDMEMAKKGNL
jgi:hypothetical protein